MSMITKQINKFFKTAIRPDVDNLRNNIILSERQEKIFNMFYIKKQSIGFIADTLAVCPMVVNNELKIIRGKIVKVLNI